LAQEWSEDCSLVGCDTLLKVPDEIPADDGSDAPYVIPDADDGRAILAVPDSRGRLKSWHFWRQQPHWKDWVSLCSETTPSEHLAYLKRKGIKTIVAGTERVDYAQALAILHREYGIGVVRVDSGGTLNGILLRAGLVDELHVLVHPMLIGGNQEQAFFTDPTLDAAGRISLQLLESRTLDHGLLLLSFAVV
jgi:2,5-diamino-6-(ribosylamino)-4(3H)-pyrimidinone 5'-phosphate reductase